MINENVVKDILIVILGNFILAFGVAFFVIPDDILTGGVAGIAVAIAPLVPISKNMMIYGLTFILFILGFLFLGKQFTLKTLLSTIVYPLFLALLTPFANKYAITDNMILSSIYAGVLQGVGVGLVFRTGASTGGMDIPPLIIHKFTNFKVATLVMITDTLTVLLGLSIHGIEPALIGLISVYLCSDLIDKTMMLGTASERSLMIISEKNEEILAEIYKNMERGATIIDAKGGYTRENRPILMIAISKKQFPLVNRIIQSIDPNAFVIVHDVYDVRGEGFTFTTEERKNANEISGTK